MGLEASVELVLMLVGENGVDVIVTKSTQLTSSPITSIKSREVMPKCFVVTGLPVLTTTTYW
jgi:hypothetical protein